MKLPHKTLEKVLLKSCKYICGVDEVGVGPLAGPVVVCAVLLTEKFFKKRHKDLAWLRDSKQLQAKQREKYLDMLLKEKDLIYSTALAGHKKIDKINIYQATRSAMAKAIKKLPYKPDMVLVDGKTKIAGVDIEQIPIIKGDRKIFSIACASIIAKVMRDKMMVNYSKKYPGYGFEKHKGYGTKLHQTQLASLGPCPIHRRSFAPVAKLL